MEYTSSKMTKEEFISSSEAWEYMMGKDSCILCPECGSLMRLQNSPRFGKFWSCSRWPSCNGTHGAHPDGTPLGIPATHETKQARIKAHEALDAYMKALGLSRNAAYKALRRLMKLSRKEGHIGRFNSSMCNLLISRLSTDLAAKTS